MNINQAFPSKYVAAADLQGRDVPVNIANVVREEVGKEEEVRPVMYFAGMKKGMVLNKTNAGTIAAIYGEETDHWIGKPITLYPSTTNNGGGKEVDCIRVRKTPPGVAAAPVAPPPPPAPVAGPVSF